MIRVLIVAPYASVRAGLHALLDGADGLLVVGEAGGAADLERVLPQARPDVVLLDESSPADSARVREVLAAIGGADEAEEEPVGLVSLAAPADGGDTATPLAGLRAALEGGWAYLSKEADGQEIAAAVRAAAAGLIVLDRGSLSPLLALASTAATYDTPPDGAPPGETLTARELEVLQLMAQGLPNKIIAARLKISLHTAKFHVASILAKLNAASRTEAVTLGARRGLVVL